MRTHAAVLDQQMTGVPASAAKTSPLASLHEHCFACGIANSIGLNLHFEVDHDGIARAAWIPSARFRGYPGRIHGGIIATALDSSIVHALFGRGIAGVTAEMTIRYLHPATLEHPLEVAGWVESVLRDKIFLCRAEARQNNRLVVRASAKFMAWNADDPHTPQAADFS